MCAAPKVVINSEAVDLVLWPFQVVRGKTSLVVRVHKDCAIDSVCRLS